MDWMHCDDTILWVTNCYSMVVACILFAATLSRISRLFPIPHSYPFLAELHTYSFHIVFVSAIHVTNSVAYLIYSILIFQIKSLCRYFYLYKLEMIYKL